MIDVCLCTHSADPAILTRVIQALCDQTLSKDQFQVFVIDNLNDPPLELTTLPFVLLKQNGVTAQIVREPKLGIAHARICALRTSEAEAVVFVDDDNVLANDFLENASEILNSFPSVGCFSGKILLPEEIETPTWIKPLLGSLAIRNIPGEPIVGWFRGDWFPWLPTATASMVLRRKVSDAFLKIHASRPEFSQFGRKGRSNLMSGEDFLIALSAADAGLQCGYFPILEMRHYIRPNRFSVQHMAKLMSLFAVTDLKREVYLNWEPKPFYSEELKYRLLALDYADHDLRARFCFWLYQAIYTTGKAYRLVKAGKPLRSRGEFR